MKTSSIAQAFAFLAATATARPTAPGADLHEYPPGTGENLHEYPPGTGENLHEYPPGTGENLHEYPPGTGENLEHYPTPPGGYGDAPPAPPADCPAPPTPAPFEFTSSFHIEAFPDQVVNGTGTDVVFTGGLEGARGFYDFSINSDLDIICYNIRLTGFRGEYQSPAKTATHVHQGARGANGPPRLAFPNPTGDGDERTSAGCLTGPFTTGLIMNGTDTGEGFTLSQIEDNPSGFFADVHSSLAVPGAVRGQFPG